MIVPTTAILGALLHAQLLTPPPRIPLPKAAAHVTRAVVHQNRTPSGRLEAGRLRLTLEMVESAWRPEGVTDPEVPILAFAEAGGTPSVPGPLLRVPVGTELIVTLRNRTDSSLVVGGLRPGFDAGADTLQVPAGTTREVRHRVGSAGTFFYWGAFAGTTAADRLWKDSQLNGALVVDGPGAVADDRVLLLSEWFHPYEDDRPFEVVSVINGKAWPHTATIEMAQGDSMRFRVINAIELHHPMHLHGFYYRIESQGDGARDVPVPPGEQHLSNTDLLAPRRTVTFSFHASTPGNWLFHCHFAFHTDETVTLVGSPTDAAPAVPVPHGDHAASAPMPHSMRGLVIGLKVRPVPGYAGPDLSGARELRLLVQRDPQRLITGADAVGFVLQRGDSVPARDSVSLPGPVLELRRGEPVRIVVRNNLQEPTSVHWHGLEIESFPDGVPFWSGLGSRVYTQIAPNDSFVAAFIPPRSGTYPYHSHLNDRHQINAGMYGALLVTDGPRDLTRDHLVVVGGGGPEVQAKFESPFALVNGRRFPSPLRLEVGVTHRVRIVSIHPDWRVSLTLRNDSTIARWRAIAKDGADLPSALATQRPAQVIMGPGETADFEFTPTVAGEWLLEVRTVEPGWFIPLPVLVVPKRP